VLPEITCPSAKLIGLSNLSGYLKDQCKYDEVFALALKMLEYPTETT
jgi:hypothetical protein